MTHHPRRPGRKANRRPGDQPKPRLADPWADLTRHLQLPGGMRVYAAPAGTDPRVMDPAISWMGRGG